MTAMGITEPEPVSVLQTLPAEFVPVFYDTLAARGAEALLGEALGRLIHPDHNRSQCSCDTCWLYRRIQTALRRDQ